MKTTVTGRGQTAVPGKLREKYGIKPGDRLEWIDDGRSIKVVPVSGDPVRALRGSSKGAGLVQKLLESRRQDKSGGS